MIDIRTVSPNDAEQILGYCKTVGGETDNLTFGAEGLSITVEEERKFIEDFLGSDRQIFLVAEENGEIVGIAHFSSSPKPRLAHRGEIGLSVKQSVWGRGAGTRLLEELIRFARDTARVRLISLEVRSDNHRAISLYQRFGFQTAGVFPGFLNIGGEEVSADLMILRLP